VILRNRNYIYLLGRERADFVNDPSPPPMSNIIRKSRRFAALVLLGCAFVLVAFSAISATGERTASGETAIAAASDPRCSESGLLILSDATGDTLAPAVTEYDLQRLSIAEPASLGTGKIMLILKVASLASPPPESFWSVQFNVGSTTYTARMSTVPPATPENPRFEYFAAAYNDVIGALATAADPASNYNADGTIQIVLPRSGIGNPPVGSNLTNLVARASLYAGALFSNRDVMPNTGTGGPYPIIGSEVCAGGSVGPTPTPTPPPDAPRFINYYAPPGWLQRAGEPTVGVNWNTENVSRPKGVNPPAQTFTTTFRDGTQQVIGNGGTAMYYGGINPYFLRANFDDCSSPALVDWAQIQIPVANAPRGAYDPILFTDHWTGRTFVCQEFGLTPGGSSVEWTDNDGDNMWLSQGGAPSGGIDHQTIGGGPFHAPTPPRVVTPKIPTSPPGATPVPDPNATPYPHGVWYASQNVASATSQTSVDGGFSFPTNNPMFTAADCAGLHGHLKVAEDGTLFVPDKACEQAGVPFVFGGHPAVAVSEDNGTTWQVRIVPDATSTAGVRDPSVGVSWCPPGTCSDAEKAERSKHIYLGFMYADGRPGIAYSNNKGQSWVRTVDLGALTGIKHSVFHAVVVGDPGRASMTFLGTTTAGAWSTAAFPGVWHLYAATTYDFGQTWDVKNISPEGPIQRGGICFDGTCRNLLDFQDTELDRRGRIVVAGQDGCIGGCELGGNNSFTAKAFISRQSGGKSLFSIYDAETAEPHVPGAPLITGGHDSLNTKVTLRWPAPDHGGSAITSYNVYRSNIPNPDWAALTPIATVTEPRFIDRTFTPGEDRYYIVTAVNAVGESPYCKVFHPELFIEPSPCELPGILAIDDVRPDGTDADEGQNIPPDARVNIRQMFVAEPFIPGSEDLVFTMQVAPAPVPMAPPPPYSQWFIIWNRQGTHPADPNDARFDRMYVAMATDAVGNIKYDYGKFGHPINTSVPPPPPTGFENTPYKFGEADSGSYDQATGVITIRIAKSKLRAIDGGAARYQALSDLPALNIRTYFDRPDYQPDANPPVRAQRSQNNASDITGDSSYALVGNASCAPAAELLSAVSRKTHGSAGEFDVQLFPQIGNTPTIEPRRGGTPGNHQIVMVFPSPVTFTGATVSGGGAASTEPAPGSAPVSEVKINLSNVPNAGTVSVNLTGVSAGASASTLGVQMRVLLGDINVDGAVNSGDAQVVRNQSGSVVDRDNFRSDVTLDGVINSGDAFIVRRQSGTGF
jgi:hypothetical protein